MLKIKVKFIHRSYIYSELNFVCNPKMPAFGPARHLPAKAYKKPRHFWVLINVQFTIDITPMNLVTNRD